MYYFAAGALTGITNSKCGVKKAGTKIVNGDDTEVSFYLNQYFSNSSNFHFISKILLYLKRYLLLPVG